MMKTLAMLPLLILFCGGSVIALNFVDSTEGTWPKTWPAELEPLRKQATSGRGGTLVSPYHEIRFSNRETFESAWPHILSLKSKGTSLTLLNGNHYYQNSKDVAAGVMICPPMKGQDSGPLSKTRITLMVDGSVIDLNRIVLPESTPIVDDRFKK